jgi:hypothetical protein
MSEWQPIETAPKDGSVILAWRKHATIPMIVGFDPSYGEWEDVYNYNGVHVYHITHWMPLPEPPEISP